MTGVCGSPVTSSAATLSVNDCSLPRNLNEDVTVILLRPNPSQHTITLQVKSRWAMPVEWSVMDAYGRTLMRVRQHLKAGANRQLIEVYGLPGGTYYLSGRTFRGTLKMIRFVKI